MPKNVICNVFCYITQSEYLIVFWILGLLHVELHFISVGMWHQILLNKQANSGVFFCSNWLNVLGPGLPESALYYIIFCRGTKTISVCLCKIFDQQTNLPIFPFQFFLFTQLLKVGKKDNKKIQYIYWKYSVSLQNLSINKKKHWPKCIGVKGVFTPGKCFSSFSLVRSLRGGVKW